MQEQPDQALLCRLASDAVEGFARCLATHSLFNQPEMRRRSALHAIPCDSMRPQSLSGINHFSETHVDKARLTSAAAYCRVVASAIGTSMVCLVTGRFYLEPSNVWKSAVWRRQWRRWRVPPWRLRLPHKPRSLHCSVSAVAGKHRPHLAP